MAVIPTPVPSRPTPLLPHPAPFTLSSVAVLWLLCAIVVCGVSLRFYHLSYLSLWSDEAFSRFYYETGLPYMWTEGLQRESSPPLYYMALGGWIQLFGSSEAALRSLSAVTSSLAIPLIYILGKELFDRPHGLAAAALFALSPTAIYYAQEARAYALLLLPVLTTLIACARLLRNSAGLGSLALYVAGAIASIYTHTTMLFFVTACAIAVVVLGWRFVAEQRARFLLRWVAANAVVAIVALPLVISMASPTQLRQLTWIAPLNLHDIGAAISNTLVGMLTPAHFPGAVLAILVAAVLLISIWRDFPAPRAALIALAIPALYAVFIVVVSGAVQPIFLSRIFSWTVIALCLLEARACLARGWLRPLAIAAIAATIGVGLSYQLAAPADAKEPWREVIQSAAGRLDRADLVVLAPGTDPAAVMYYAPRLSHVAMWWSERLTPSELGIMPGIFGIPGITEDDVARQITTGSSLSLIARASDEAAVSRLLSRVRPAQSRIDRNCVGGDGQPTNYPCGIAILSWGAASATTTAGGHINGER
ncbi:MAG TPA: glycosyltransferase family 39 protein [Stellaceae bacterium]|jgi:4-amino-4-deoxy-L-arabinose transferase-like glycosyltransferase|nr:glycosyltransferase family 39 protein [Stellaceae bacterium]